MSDSALSDLKVIDCGQMIAAPYCAKMLGDMGADVVKVEPPGPGDVARGCGPFPDNQPDPERSGLFLYLNTSKRGVTVDLASESGRELLHKLVKDADVLVESHPPSLRQQLGIDYETLSSINPQLVMTSVTPFGQTGPYRDYQAHDLNLWHIGGMGYITREEKLGVGLGPPSKAGGRQADFAADVTAAVATMTAIQARSITGRGQWVDVSEMECVASLPQAPIAFPPLEGRMIGDSYQPAAPGGLVACSDGWVLVRPVTEIEWNNLAAAMGNPEWAKEELWADRQSRIDNFDFLTDKVQRWASEHTRDEILESTQRHHVPVAALNTAEDVVCGEQFEAREFFVEIDHPRAGPIKYPAGCYKFSETPWRAERAAPMLGQHNDEVLGELGLSDDQIRSLRHNKVIEV